MKKFWRKDKPQPKPIIKRYCDKGHEVPEGLAVRLSLGSATTRWLCPYCVVEFIDRNISGLVSEENK